MLQMWLGVAPERKQCKDTRYDLLGKVSLIAIDPVVAVRSSLVGVSQEQVVAWLLR
jgi:hypothetical protein